MSVVSDKFRGTKEYHIIFNELITAARYRGTITYQEIAKLIGLPLQGSHMGSAIGRLLGAISEDEMNNRRPLLSAVAVNIQGTPGPGFYALARDLGKLTGESREAEKEFWASEMKAVNETWKVALEDD